MRTEKEVLAKSNRLQTRIWLRDAEDAVVRGRRNAGGYVHAAVVV